MSELYVDPDKLKNILIEYDRYNIEDDLSWVEKTNKRRDRNLEKANLLLAENENEKDNKKVKNKIDIIDKDNKLFNEYVKFSKQIKTDIVSKLENGELTKAEYDDKFKKIKLELYLAVQEIVYRRLGQLGVYKTFDYDSAKDVISNVICYIIHYANRFNVLSTTSPFAYITQMANNAYYLEINKKNARNEQEVLGLDFLENVNHSHKVCTMNFSEKN